MGRALRRHRRTAPPDAGHVVRSDRWEPGVQIDEDGPDQLLEMAAKARAICRKPKGHDEAPLDVERLVRACEAAGIAGAYRIAAEW